MKPVDVLEVYTTKISYSLFLLKNLENLMIIEKMYCSESQKSLSQQILFEFFLFRFHFVFACQHLHCYYYEYPMKHAASLYLKLFLKPEFCSVLLLLNFFLNI